MEDFGYVIHLIETYGYFVVFFGIFIECIGVPFPGETTLILAAVMASRGHLNLAAVIILAAFAAILGDNLGYIVGKKFGRKIIKKFERFPLFHYTHIERAESFFKRHGSKTVFIGRFIAVVRTYAAVFAGIFNMKYSTFLFYNVTGGITWAITFGLLGNIIGKNFKLLGIIISDFHITVLVLVGCFIGYKLGKMYFRKRKERLDEANIEI